MVEQDLYILLNGIVAADCKMFWSIRIFTSSGLSIVFQCNHKVLIKPKFLLNLQLVKYFDQKKIII